jgi:septal ring factor EnvC (AmiA/AmiB activator)
MPKKVAPENDATEKVGKTIFDFGRKSLFKEISLTEKKLGKFDKKISSHDDNLEKLKKERAEVNVHLSSLQQLKTNTGITN